MRAGSRLPAYCMPVAWLDMSCTAGVSEWLPQHRPGVAAGAQHLPGARASLRSGLHSLQLPIPRRACAPQEEQHPGCAMGIGSNKEGFSVFGVLNKCVTSMGRRLLRLWFMRPLTDLDALAERQDAIEVVARCDHMLTRVRTAFHARARLRGLQALAGAPDACKTLRNLLRRIKDVPHQLQRLQAQSVRDAKDFSALSDSLANLLMLRSALATSGLAAPAGTPGLAQCFPPICLLAGNKNSRSAVGVAAGDRQVARDLMSESFPTGDTGGRTRSSTLSVSQVIACASCKCSSTACACHAP